MKAISEMTLGELAAFVNTHLRKKGISCVLTGGACVSIYTENKYKSYDLDFIENVTSKRTDIIEALNNIGFVEEDRYFKHPDTQFFIEFPAGPLAVGSEPIKEIYSLQFKTGELKLLSPTDSVKDRLAAYYHWNDPQCLDQAVMISKNYNIDIKEIERWSKIENKIEAFKSIKDRLIKKHS